MLIKELTDQCGISGFEEEVRHFIEKRIEKDVDSLRVDTMGNLIAFKKGVNSQFRVMVSAHMDEVGFMVTGINDNGSIRIKGVGGIDDRILPGQRILVGDKRIPGIIGIKPIHLQSGEERRSVVKLKNLFIDLGYDKKEEAEKHISPGDPVYFDSAFVAFGDGRIKAKALDDRVGCAVLMALAKKSYAFDLYLCFTVQEEVGLRGSEVCANFVKPHLGIVVEGTTCSDVAGVKKQDYSTVLGNGAALTIMDNTAHVDKQFLAFVKESAKKHTIKFQYKQTTTGGNDAGKIQRSGTGVKVVSISVPCRYIHSPVSVMSLRDFESVKALVSATLDDLSEGNCKGIQLMCGGVEHV